MLTTELPKSLQVLPVRAKRVLCRLEVDSIDKFLSLVEIDFLGVKNSGRWTAAALLRAQEKLRGNGSLVETAKEKEERKAIVAIRKIIKAARELSAAEKAIQEIEDEHRAAKVFSQDNQ